MLHLKPNLHDNGATENADQQSGRQLPENHSDSWMSHCSLSVTSWNVDSSSSRLQGESRTQIPWLSMHKQTLQRPQESHTMSTVSYNKHKCHMQAAINSNLCFSCAYSLQQRHCWSGDKNGILPVKIFGVIMLVVTIWLELCTAYSSSSHHHNHHP